MGCCSSNYDQEDLIPNCIIIVCYDYTESQDLYIGDGIKRTNAWHGTVSNNQLRKRREEFWKSQKTGNRLVWHCIRQAIETDSESALLMLDMNQITTENNTLSVCYDHNGFRYEIPAWVINDPIKFSSQDLGTEINNVCKSQTSTQSDAYIELKLRNASNPQDVILKLSNSLKVKSLKQMYCSQLRNLNSSQVRLFFGGKELKDEHCLSDLNIENGMVIQAFIKRAI